MSTVLNPHPAPSTATFFGPSLGLNRQDRPKHPFFVGLTKQQWGFFWQPEEVKLVKDAIDFKNLAPHEQHIFTSNLKRQILLDSVQGRAPVSVLGPIATQPEVETWIRAWSMFEDIHSYSYRYILENVYSDTSKVYDEVLEIPDIIECGKDIAREYDNLAEWNNYLHSDNPAYRDPINGKRALWKCLHAINILEGVRFYVSFACSWAFAEAKKMEGNAKIIRLICLSADTDILTENGWKRFYELGDGEKVAQYTETGDIEFVVPLHKIEENYTGDLLRFSNRRHDFSVTPDHRIIYKQSGKLKESLAKDYIPNCTKSYPVAGRGVGNKQDLTALEKFRIAFQADGSFCGDEYNGKFSGCNAVLIPLTKKRKIERLEGILAELGYEYSANKQIAGHTTYYIKVPTEVNITKDFSWVNLGDVGAYWAKQFLFELSRWDGHIRTDCDGHLYYSSTTEACVDVAQAVCVLSDWRHYRSVQHDDRKETYKDVHRLFIDTKSNVVNAGNAPETVSVEPYDGKVYCVTVPSGMIVVRRNNKVVVTGNCRDENLHLGGTQYLLKALPKEDEVYHRLANDPDIQKEVLRMWTSAVDQEKAWAGYLFKDGSMVGLNETLLSDYVEWKARRCCDAIGLPSEFKGGSNPLPWTQSWISGSDIQEAPQEVEKGQYVVSGLKPDITSDTFKDFKL